MQEVKLRKLFLSSSGQSNYKIFYPFHVSKNVEIINPS